MWKIWANLLLPKALKTCQKSNKSPNLVTLLGISMRKSTGKIPKQFCLSIPSQCWRQHQCGGLLVASPTPEAHTEPVSGCPRQRPQRPRHPWPRVIQTSRGPLSHLQKMVISKNGNFTIDIKLFKKRLNRCSFEHNVYVDKVGHRLSRSL